MGSAFCRERQRLEHTAVYDSRLVCRHVRHERLWRKLSPVLDTVASLASPCRW